MRGGGADLKDHGGLDAAFDWGHVERAVFKDGGYGFWITDVAGGCCDFDSA